MSQTKSAVPAEVRKRLTELAGVREVDFAGYPDRVSISCDIDGAQALTAEAVSTILQAEAGVRPEVHVDLDSAGSPLGGRRMRFAGLQMANPEPGRLSARVTLEWNEEYHEGQGYGEANPAGELRASALAAMRALERVLADEATFTLVGIKELYVFDHNFVAVLLHSPRFADRRMIGISIITEDRRRAAVLAVLNATNRAVGSLTEGEI